ncbi:Ndr family protein [Leptospira broomii serovar Hurstbridge str. 5399]|uniref:Ndr family protein n=1 Tax=Leptospira broomii serovar Hurstbridge str. 5399 TaxID=1049789 RepID=T0F919_9LEPT|nr:alpha/beta hydrolase [Leptospira broomii]EQA44411.1 Ndr family protein [Leptospira broomii serovar Hurstbridge str. 5399]
MKQRLMIIFMTGFTLFSVFCGVNETVMNANSNAQDSKEDKPSGFFESKYGKVAYWIKGKGRTVFLLHSAGHDHRDFDAIVPALTSKYRVICLDWPGHGISSNPTPPSSASALSIAEVLQEVAVQLAPDGAVFLGNSVGGFASLKMALEKPKLVKGLILVDTGGMNAPDFKTRTFTNLKGTLWFTGLSWTAFPKYYLKIRNEYTNQIVERIREKGTQEGAKEVNAAIWRSFLAPGHDLREKVREIKQPTLIVWGAEDPVLEPSLGKTLHGEIKNSQAVFLKTGHVPFAEDPDAFLRAAIPFLDSIKY